MSQSKTKNSSQKRKIKSILMKGNKFGYCCFCKKRVLINNVTLEHIIPLAFGGDWSLKNLTLSCVDCNKDRGVAKYEDYKHWKQGKIKIKPTTDINKVSEAQCPTC